MEKAERSKKRKITTRHETSSSSIVLVNTDSDTIFTLLLATLSNCDRNSPKTQSFIKKCLIKLQSNNNSQHPLPNSILSLLPVLLLTSKSLDIACRSAEIVGVASLLSLEMNERIALDGDIVKALVLCSVSSNKRVSISACNALLDLSTTSIGRHQLFQFCALEKLIIGFLQDPIPLVLIFLCAEEDRSAPYARITFKEDGHAGSLLNAAIFLINSCNVEQLEKIPRNLCASFLEFLKQLWRKVHSQMLLGEYLTSISDANLCTSNISINNLAESIFRLSSSSDQFSPFPSASVKSWIFGQSKHSFETFMLCHWEESPFLMRRPSTFSVELDDIFSPFTDSLIHTESPCNFLAPMLQSCISCLPIASNEFDILNFLEDVRNELGCPIIYHQDIRVLRTEQQSKKEVHIFPENFNPYHIKNRHCLSFSDIMKCGEAYEKGYTIALRGMEFRFASIAPVADTLACLFGQPSVGANLYLTPPNSQGLARHYDDHCVFVCQLFGNKQWTIVSEPNKLLPRLYDPIDSHDNFDSESSSADHKNFFLKEGDVLYVPRGFAHEAHTDDSRVGEPARSSLHITFGIEVEPPFEWAGFAHIALHHWNQTQKWASRALVGLLPESLNAITVYLLHAMIELIGASDPVFRKACLVGALFPALDKKDWLYSNQKTVFCDLIDKINGDSRFLEVLNIVEIGIEKNNLLQRMKWIQLLNKENETIEGHDLDTNSMGIESLLPEYVLQQDEARASFVQMKTRFCAKASFEDVIDSYMLILDKYKKVRKQYLNGMLSLHCN